MFGHTLCIKKGKVGSKKTCPKRILLIDCILHNHLVCAIFPQAGSLTSVNYVVGCVAFLECGLHLR